MTYDTVTGMPTFVFLVLRRLFPRWTSERMERYLGDTRHLGSHDLEDTLFYCTLSREMFDLLRSILHVHFSTRYFTDIPEPISFDRDEEPGDEELAIDGLAGPHQVDALRSAVAAEYNDSASPVAHYLGLSKAGCLQIVQWLIRNRFDRLHHILQSDDSQPALRDLIKSNRQSPALLEIEWYALSPLCCAVLCLIQEGFVLRLQAQSSPVSLTRDARWPQLASNYWAPSGNSAPQRPARVRAVRTNRRRQDHCNHRHHQGAHSARLAASRLHQGPHTRQGPRLLCGQHIREERNVPHVEI